MRSWSRFWRLSRAERRMLAQALVLLPLTVAVLRLLGFRRCQTVPTRLAPRRTNRPAAIDEAGGMARMIEVAARHGLVRATCRPQSLVLWCLLRRRGFDSELRIGGRSRPIRRHERDAGSPRARR